MVKIRVGKGKTFQDGDEWQKEYFEIEMEIEEKDIEVKKNWASSTIESWFTPTPEKTNAQSTPAAQTPQTRDAQLGPGKWTKESILKAIPDNFVKEVDIEETSVAFVIRIPFMSSDKFATIAQVIRNLGGEYISAGRSSHFRIRK